jgi:hypothetical protein
MLHHFVLNAGRTIMIHNRTFPSTSQCPTPPNPEAYLEEALSSALFHFWLLSKQKLMDILEVEINGSSGEKTHWKKFEAWIMLSLYAYHDGSKACRNLSQICTAGKQVL